MESETKKKICLSGKAYQKRNCFVLTVVPGVTVLSEIYFEQKIERGKKRVRIPW